MLWERLQVLNTYTYSISQQHLYVDCIYRQLNCHPTRRVANYEIGCANANSAMQFEEGPRLGVFEKANFLVKKPKKENK